MLNLDSDNRFAPKLADIRERVSALPPEKAAALEADMAVTFEEHFRFQNLQAQAHAAGRIRTSEAQVIYLALGEGHGAANGGWARDTDLATKVLVTLAMGELLALEAARARA